MKARDLGRPEVRPCPSRTRNASALSTSESRSVEYPKLFLLGLAILLQHLFHLCRGSRCCAALVSGCS